MHQAESLFGFRQDKQMENGWCQNSIFSRAPSCVLLDAGLAAVLIWKTSVIEDTGATTWSRVLFKYILIQSQHTPKIPTWAPSALQPTVQ